MTIISPSILACDFLNLQTEIESFKDSKNIQFHIDVMDGHYVPNLSFGKCVLNNINTITDHPLDVHLMVSNPKDYVDDFSHSGISNLTFHWEATNHHDSLISQIKYKYNSVGISINPSTPVSAIPDYVLERIDILLIMSVNPGFGGQYFIKSSIDKVIEASNIRDKKNLSFKIQIDGGVTDSNAKELISSGADILVAGSYIFKNNSSEYNRKIESLR
jgi:ribulose-phosphate 3-epimerase